MSVAPLSLDTHNFTMLIQPKLMPTIKYDRHNSNILREITEI